MWILGGGAVDWVIGRGGGALDLPCSGEFSEERESGEESALNEWSCVSGARKSDSSSRGSGKRSSCVGFGVEVGGEGEGVEGGGDGPVFTEFRVSRTPSSNWPSRSPPTQLPSFVALADRLEPMAHFLSPEASCRFFASVPMSRLARGSLCVNL